VAFGIVFLVYGGLTGILFPALGIKDTESRELLCVPIMQMVNVSHEHFDEIPKSEIALLETYIDLESAWINYNPRFADPVKDFMYQDTQLIPLLRLWGKWMLRYPLDYLQVHASLHLPYWFINNPVPDPYSKRSYIETDLFVYTNDYVRPNAFPELYAFYHNYAQFTLPDQIPVVRILLGISFPFSFLLFITLIALWKRDRITYRILLLQFLLFGTYFLGPVSNFRYVYPLFLCYPVYLGFVLRKE
jgi:hypothetical protein